MTALRSVGAQLALALALVVAIALAVVYVIVVPSLERNLVAAKVDALRRASEPISRSFPTSLLTSPDLRFDISPTLNDIAGATNSRVVIYEPLTLDSLSVVEDSRGGRSSRDVQDDPIAIRTAAVLAPAHGTVTRDGERYAEAAYPLYTASGTVILFSSSLEDTLANVELVRKRVLLAAAPALLVAVFLGYGLASVFARRISRLERAADRIAGGRFDEPVAVSGNDELAQLGRAFERMRLRLAQLERARREFIANASHELRTPIFSLGGFVELMANEDLDEQTRREFLTTMQEQVARLQKLATDLLDLSRLDAGQLVVDLEPLELASLAEAVVDEFAPIAHAAGQELEVEGRGEALADELRVLQIARILVENAIRHTPAGTQVSIRAGSSGGGAFLEVEDDGPGIPDEYAEHVFERFYRVEGNRASGSGLGLAIARELAVLMDGSLELDSRGGRTRFRLVLPAAAPTRELVPA